MLTGLNYYLAFPIEQMPLPGATACKVPGSYGTIHSRWRLSLTEVMYRIGIQTQSYFTKAFKKEFGKTPTQFMQEIKRV